MSLICFSGVPGSGKTTLAKAVADSMGLLCGSFGGYVRYCARQRGLSLERATLQELGQSLVDDDPRGFCRATLIWLGWTPARGLILEGMRHVIVYDALIDLVRPTHVRLVFVDVDRSVQIKRLKARDGEVEHDRLISNPTEAEVSSVLRPRADLVVSGDASLDSMVAEVATWIRENQLG